MSHARSPLVQLLLTWASLSAAHLLAATALPLPALADGALPWLGASNLLVAAVIVALARRSDWRGLRLGLALGSPPLLVELTNIVEAAFFLPQADSQWLALVLRALLAFGAVVALWAGFLGRYEVPVDRHRIAKHASSKIRRAAKFLLCVVAYAVIYFIAGIIVYPYVREFYATQSLPSPATVLLLQLLLRGPVFVAVCLLLLRMGNWPRARGALHVAVLFASVSAIAPLLPPNPYFGDAIRWIHFGEVVASNLIFGALVAWSWGARAGAAMLPGGHRPGGDARSLAS